MSFKNIPANENGAESEFILLFWVDLLSYSSIAAIWTTQPIKHHKSIHIPHKGRHLPRRVRMHFALIDSRDDVTSMKPRLLSSTSSPHATHCDRVGAVHGEAVARALRELDLLGGEKERLVIGYELREKKLQNHLNNVSS